MRMAGPELRVRNENEERLSRVPAPFKVMKILLIRIAKALHNSQYTTDYWAQPCKQRNIMICEIDLDQSVILKSE